MKAVLFAIGICPFFCMANSSDTLTTRIRIFDKTDKNYPIDITAVKSIAGEYSVLLHSIFKTKENTLSLRLATPTFVDLEMKGNFYPIFLSPGDKLEIHVNGNFVSLRGTGASLNTCLIKTDSVRKVFDRLSGKTYAQLNVHRFLERVDSLQHALSEMTSAYFPATSTVQTARNLMLKKNQVVISVIKANYVLTHYYDDHNEFTVPDSLKNFKRWIIFDPEILASNLQIVYTLCGFFLNKEIYRSTLQSANDDELTQIYKNCASIFAKKIMELNLKKEVTQFLLAANINLWVDQFGIIPDIQDNYSAYIDSDAPSLYKILLTEKYNRWKQIDHGQAAPNIKGNDLHDHEINLTDLHGKVVYVDIWATWCGPCVAEMPDARKLQEEFRNNHNLVFLNVSIDKDIDQWKQFVNEKLADSGLHINDSQAEILTSYLNSGVPRHILIDRNGKIYKAVASGPSSHEARAEILAALEEGK